LTRRAARFAGIAAGAAILVVAVAGFACGIESDRPPLWTLRNVAARAELYEAKRVSSVRL